MQKTNFNYQLVIGEDSSTDSTLSICKSFAKKYRDKIKLLPSLNKNVGLINNYMRTIKACDGKYIAICDGDDYWIDEYKLQKQVDFLETHTDFVMVYTGYNKLYPDNTKKKAVQTVTKLESDFSDLIQNNFIASVTVMFRNIESLKHLPNWILKFPYGDWPTYLLLLKDGGKIHFLDQITAEYRMEIGVSAPLLNVNSDLLKVNLGILNCILEDPNFTNKKQLIQQVIADKNKELIASYNREKKYSKAVKQLFCNLLYYKNKRETIKMYIYSLLKRLK